MRKLMLFTIGFSAACVLGAYGSHSSLLTAFLCLMAALGFAFLSLKWKSCRIPVFLLMGISVGICWFHLYDCLLLSDARALDGQILKSTVEVTDYSYETDYGTAVDGVMEIDGRKYRVRIYLKDKTELSPGDRITSQFRFRFTAVGGAENPTYHRSNGVFLLLYQKGTGEYTASSTEKEAYSPVIWRRKLLTLLDELFPADTAVFAKALLLGEKSELDYETSTAFRVSGISHVVAVSGLHVSILFGLVFLVAGKRRVLTALVGIPTVFLFAAIVGFTPSVTRAAIMQILMMLALLFNREYDPPTALSAAAMVILALNPLSISSVSFQLSFGCLIGIFLFTPQIRIWLLDDSRLGSGKGKGSIPRLKRWLATSISITTGASMVTTSIVAYYFGTVSLIGVLTNLLVLWIIPVIFYGIMICCAVGLFFPAAGQVAAAVIAWPIRYVLAAAKWLASFPLAAVYTESIYIVIWLIGCYLLLAFFLLSKNKNAVVFFSCVALSLCSALGLSWAEPLADDCRVTVLDVGQGQSIILQSEGKTFLVDCGGSDNEDAADKAAETLFSMGICRLDGIIVTHMDADHAGGVGYLLSRIDTDLLLLPDIADKDGTAASLAAMAGDGGMYVSENLVLTFGDSKLTVAAPISKNADNESSLCILFQAGNCDILITGDRGFLGEMMLLRQIDLPQIELLIVGHHGSANSTSEELLAVIRPETAVISVGKDNTYGHPRQEVLDRLEAVGCTVYRTDLMGTIVYRR